jgi:hypothetical protein
MSVILAGGVFCPTDIIGAPSTGSTIGGGTFGLFLKRTGGCIHPVIVSSPTDENKNDTRNICIITPNLPFIKNLPEYGTSSVYFIESSANK